MRSWWRLGFVLLALLPATLSARVTWHVVNDAEAHGGSEKHPVLVARATTRDKAARPERGRWQFVHAHGKTGCAARRHRFGFWTRLLSRRRLLIYFEGGGGCFSYRTCARGSTWFDAVVNGMDDPQRRPVGIFDLADRRDPFRGWSIVFIPSCTGDVFIGSTDHTYRQGDKQVTIRHRGWFNAEAAVHWAFRHVPDAERVFLAGSSAGSVGSAFHAPEVIDHYGDGTTSQLGDSLAFVSRRPMSLTEWHGLDHLPSWMRGQPDVRPGRFRMVAFLAHLIRHYPKATFARFDFRADFVQERFYAADGGDPGDFSRALVRDERMLRSRAPRYRSLLACGTGHMVLPSRGFYSVTVSGIGLRNWVARIADGRAVRSAACGKAH